MTLSGNRLAQRPMEFAAFKQWIRTNKLKSVLEIGSRYGDALYEIATECLPEGGKVVSVDLVDGLWGRADSKAYLDRCIAKLKEEGYDAHVIYGNSRTSAVINLVTSRGPYDLVFIDGDHTLEGATADWENYGRLGRYVAFHDIDGDGQFYSKTHDPVDIPQLWQALKKRYEHKEWIDHDNRGMGIGIILKENPLF